MTLEVFPARSVALNRKEFSPLTTGIDPSQAVVPESGLKLVPSVEYSTVETPLVASVVVPETANG